MRTLFGFLFAVACFAQKAYLVPAPPSGLTPARNLSHAGMQGNFEALWSVIDTTYADFKLKSIDWKAVGRRYRERLASVKTDDEFYTLLFQLVNELKDTLSWLQNQRPPFTQGVPDLAIDLFNGKPFLVAVRPGSAAAAAGLAPGWEVLAVDGLSYEEKLEALRPYLHACSSERAYRLQAARGLLSGQNDSLATLKLRSPDGRVQTLALQRRPGPSTHPPERKPDFELTRQRFVHYGRHPSGLGYIWIESFSAHQEVADEFDLALEALRDTPALILDIRDNSGGFGQTHIVGRLLTRRVLAAVSHVKSGPRHNDLKKQEVYISPAGDWQYTRSVALLVNGGTGSASDLFACELRSAHRVLTIGSTTHGNLSGVGAYAVLPCGLVVRVSNGYVCDAKDRPVEINGNVPDVAVEGGIADFLNHRDPVLEKAVELLRK